MAKVHQVDGDDGENGDNVDLDINAKRKAADNRIKIIDSEPLRQVRINFMEIGWLTEKDEEGEVKLEFIKTLLEDGDINLFLHDSIKELTSFMWDISKPYFLNKVFIPFIFLQFMPVALI